MSQMSRKLMAKKKALHPREDIDRLYARRKEGGRILTSIEDCVVHQYKHNVDLDDIKKSKG